MMGSLRRLKFVIYNQGCSVSCIDQVDGRGKILIPMHCMGRRR
jgi:hypothetical protein